MAESFWKSFKEEGGTNFVILECNAPEGIKLIVTLKRADGKTPEEVYAMLQTALRDGGWRTSPCAKCGTLVVYLDSDCPLCVDCEGKN